MRSLVCLTGCLLLFACGNHGSQRVPGVGIRYRVESTTPANGAEDVEPDSELVVEFSEPAAFYVDGAFAVSDAAGDLPGRFELSADALTMRWIPDRQLPRGHRVTLRQNGFGGGVPIATFTVRDATTRVEHTFPGLRARAVFAWPSGRRAVTTFSGSFEVAAQRVMPLAVGIPVEAKLFGDASFVYWEHDLANGRINCVRGDLDGSLVRVRTPADRPVVACNSVGDAVVFVPNDVGQPTERGLWRLDHLATTWQWVGPLDLAAGADVGVAIDRSGNVMASYARLGQPVVERFAYGAPVAQVYEPQIEGTASAVSFDVGDDGVGVLLWIANVTSRPLRAARLVPDVGLQSIAIDQQTFSFETRVDMSHAGSTLLRYREQNGYGSTTSEREYARRLERDGLLGQNEMLGSGTQLFGVLRSTHWDRVRGDYWSVTADASSGLVRRELRVQRSLPAAPLGAEEPLFEVLDANRAIKGYFLAIDASGRAILAVNEGPTNGLPDTCRVVLLD